MGNHDVLISGAGVAGPALAYWLRRHGFSPTVVERAPVLREGGHAIDIRGSARELVERMGALDAVLRARIDLRGMAYTNSKGKPVGKLPVELFGLRGDEPEQIEILRSDLVRALYDVAQDGVEYLFDDTVTGLTEDAEGVKVTFARNAPRVFDLVVGADGVHSRVRALAFGDETRFFRKSGGYTAFCTIPKTFDLGGWDLFHNAPGRRMIAVRPGKPGIDSKALFSFASPELVYDRRDVAGQKRIVAEKFADVGWLASEVLAAMQDADDFAFDVAGEVHMDSWSSGRAVLLGDACASGAAAHGTTLAIIEAYVLAGELKAAGGDHETAFARYEDFMRPYVAKAQEGPPGGYDWMLPKTRRGIWLRNQSMRSLRHMPWRSLLARGAAEATDVPLKEY
jgi:2-polyprenyl-6-methoxyphenol hydroxylase-like FAD-dependent oxidoreductase